MTVELYIPCQQCGHPHSATCTARDPLSGGSCGCDHYVPAAQPDEDEQPEEDPDGSW